MNKEKVSNALIIVLGNILLAVGISLFIIPFDIDNGGLAGISVILKKIFDPAIVIFILNWILFFVGLMFLKKDFALKTLISTIVYPVVVNLLYHSPIYNLVLHEVSDSLLAGIVGALLSGVGLGIVYRVGGSTGGLDVIAVMFNKFKGMKISVSTFVIDFIIVFIY